MFKLAFNIKNPFHKENDDFRSETYFHREPLLTQHKAMNFQISKFDAFHIIDFDFTIEFSGRDHAGPNLHCWIFGYGFVVQLYDTRHWDYENERWQEYVDNVEENK
jgi:hypothetical protein